MWSLGISRTPAILRPAGARRPLWAWSSCVAERTARRRRAAALAPGSRFSANSFRPAHPFPAAGRNSNRLRPLPCPRVHRFSKVRSSPPPLGATLALGALLFSTTQQGLFLVSPLDGRVIDGIHTGEGFSMPPSVHGQRAFIVSNGGRFYSFVITPPI